MRESWTWGAALEASLSIPTASILIGFSSPRKPGQLEISGSLSSYSAVSVRCPILASLGNDPSLHLFLFNGTTSNLMHFRARRCQFGLACTVAVGKNIPLLLAKLGGTWPRQVFNPPAAFKTMPYLAALPNTTDSCAKQYRLNCCHTVQAILLWSERSKS